MRLLPLPTAPLPSSPPCSVSSFRRGAALVLLLAVSFGAHRPTGAVDEVTEPDPLLLPEATASQAPLKAAYEALGVPSLAAGRSYLDPTTAVKVFKLTSATWPAAGASWRNGSFEGGNEVSLPQDGGTRAVRVRQDRGDWWLVDFAPAAGASNPRPLTGDLAPSSDLAFTFSNNPATPYYAYVGSGSLVRRIDIRTMTEAPGNGWPVTGQAGATWLHQSENDGLFVWMRGGQRPTLVAFEPGTGTTKTYAHAGLDAPRIDRAGRYVGLLAGHALAVWDWNTGEVTWSTAADPDISVTHAASLKRRWLASGPSGGAASDVVVIAPDAAHSTRLLSGALEGTLSHGSGNWIQHPGDLDDQWALFQHRARAFVLLTPGGQRRLLAHPYDTTTDDARDTSATLSPDGRYVLFTSDMGGSFRRDVFLAQLPVSATHPDTHPPAVSITAPTGGATVSGSALIVEAVAWDDLEVLGVQFKLNGADLGAEDTAPPYAVSWNTLLAGSGHHTLTAVARDAAGNLGTSNAVLVDVQRPADDGSRRPGGSVVLRPQDTFINIDATNQSSSTRLATYTWPDNQVANAILLKFDLSSLPPGAVVTEATLRLALVESDASTASTYRVSAHKVVGKNPVIAAATGYMADGATPWTPNPCCHDNIPLAQADISAAYDSRNVNKSLGLKSWSVTALVQEWVANPATNFGLLLNSDASQPKDHYRIFASMEHPAKHLRPQLRITYAEAPDTTPPVISAVLANGITTSGAVIRWTTNEPADSQVDYGTSTAYGTQTPLDTTKVTTHAQTLSGLAPNTPYHFRVRSRDAAGNLAVSGDFTFTTLAGDGTPPSVAITAPPAGATVSGTVTVSANASDNVGVAGVQFKLNGANLGAEDTAPPYAIAWNTTTTTNGSHTLTAVARDAAGNQGTSPAVPVTVSNTAPGGGIAASYPGDVGIENHPDVVLVERFEETSLPPVFARWTDILNGAAMSLSSDVPPGSPGTRSLNIPWVGGGVNNGGHLYKLLTTGVDDRLYIRYYIKYPTGGQYDHSGIWMGGHNPPLAWPNPQAGIKPVGNDRFSTAAEQNPLTARFDHYDYWMGMHQSLDGNYWGNHLLNNPNVQASLGQWTCVEHMVRLNSPTTAFNGEHAIWLQGTKVSHLGQGFPNGTWNGGIFTQNPGGSPFEGFRWRSDAALKLNWIWLQVYAPDAPSGYSSSIKYDHVVLAKSYVGCLASGAPDTTPPTVSISAPPAGATVSGTITVSANAADNIGVVGVQFRLDGANLGAEDATAPYSIPWNTTGSSNGPHTLTAVARDAGGNTTTSAAIPVVVGNAAGAWPNEPAGMVLRSDWGMDQALPTAGDVPIPGSPGWRVVGNSPSGSSGGWAVRMSDPGAPFSSPNVYDFVYPQGMVEGDAPATVYYPSLGANELYVGFWWKPSSPFDYGPNGNKIAFMFNGGGQTGGQQFLILKPDGRLHVLPEYPGDYQWRTPNVNATFVTLGAWHRIEWYSHRTNGTLKWWLDGVLQGSYTDVTSGHAFDEFKFSPTWGGNSGATKDQTDHYWYDHVRLSTR
jgi:hypothetical protein